MEWSCSFFTIWLLDPATEPQFLWTLRGSNIFWFKWGHFNFSGIWGDNQCWGEHPEEQQQQHQQSCYHCHLKCKEFEGGGECKFLYNRHHLINGQCILSAEFDVDTGGHPRTSNIRILDFLLLLMLTLESGAYRQWLLWFFEELCSYCQRIARSSNHYAMLPHSLTLEGRNFNMRGLFEENPLMKNCGTTLERVRN